MKNNIEPQEDYYCKARTDKGILFFKTKADFEEWRMNTKEGALLREVKDDEDLAGGTNAGGYI